MGEEPERDRRPYLVLTRDSAIGKLNEVLVAAVTRTIRSIPTQVELDEDDGILEDGSHWTRPRASPPLTDAHAPAVYLSPACLFSRTAL